MKLEDFNKSDLSNAMQQYYDFKINNINSIVLFQLGDFYEMFFEDAVEVATLLELTLTSKSAGLSHKVPMAGVPVNSLNDYVKKLMKFNKTVAIVEQTDELIPNSKLVQRRLKKIITPGTYFDETSLDNNYVASIYYGKELWLSYGDTSTGEMYNAQFGNIEMLFNELIVLNVKEVLDPFNILSNYDTIAKHYFMQIISDKYFVAEIPLAKNSDVETSNQILLKYIDKILCGKTNHISTFKLIDKSLFMNMSINTQQQLELTATMRGNEYYGSLFWFLNKTNTAMGRRLLKKMILNPLILEHDIYYRHEIVEAMMNKFLTMEKINIELSAVYDFERLIGRISDMSILPKEVLQLKKSIARLPDIKVFLQEFDNEQLEKIANEIDPMENLHVLIEELICDDTSNNAKDGDVIKNGFSEEIDKLRALKKNSNAWLIDFEIKERKATGIKNLKIKYNRIFGYFIEITNGNVETIPGNYIRKQTMSNCERYITEELKIAEEKILNASDLCIRLEHELYLDLKEKLKTFINQLQELANKISFVDVMTSFAKVSLENHFTRPNFIESGIDIKESSHPIIKLIQSNFIYNDIKLDEDTNIQIVTGPNMAGKSTYMRQLALTVIIGQIGCFVPARECNIKLFDKIYTRIGASDDLAQGKSTFMVEMTETAEALQNATANSLLIFDELGRGTSTYDGVSLAQSIIEYISENLSCTTFFSTHYHELIDLEERYNNIKNVHVRAEEIDGELMFFHKVLPGGVGKSYGIAVAKLADLPSRVISRANVIIRDLESMHHIELKGSTPAINNIDEEKELLKIQVEKIRNLNIENITPLDALVLLNKIKNDL